jgi:hypothetical protein
MKISPYFIVVLFLAGCFSRREPISRLKEFEYPMDSLLSGKIFVYRKNLPGEFTFTEARLVKENGTDFLVYEMYDAKKKISAEKFAITNDGTEQIDAFFYDYPDSTSNEFEKVRMEIVESTNIDDGLKYSGLRREMEGTSSNDFTGEMEMRHRFIREDSIEILGQHIDALVFTNDVRVKAWYRYLPFFSSETTYTGEYYLARGLGVVKYSSNTEKEKSEWTLQEIRSVK